MKLKRYSNGIYMLGDVKISKQQPLVVAVHPYSAGNHSSEVYRKSIRRILRDPNRAVLILEEELMFGDRLKHLEKDCGDITFNRFLVKTEYEDPKLVKCSKEDLFELSSRFKQPPQFVGGRYYEVEEDGESYWRGCLGLVFQDFLEAGFNGRIIRRATFT